MTSSPRDLPLTGLKVLELSRLLPGPFAARLLADLGAEVVKIEDPIGGDYLRHTPPLVEGVSAHFISNNTNKRSVALDLKTESGREALRHLLGSRDILIESFRPGVMARLGLGYEQLSAWQPRMIFASLTGYGQTGPYRDRAGHDLNYLALAGAAGLTGQDDGRPVVPGVQVADLSGALYLVVALLAAVHRREQTGLGCYIDLAMADAALALLALPFAEYVGSRVLPGPAQMVVNGKYICYRLYRTRDNRYLSLAALEPKFWAAFCQAVDKPQWCDEAFSPARTDNPVFLELETLFASKDQADWRQTLANADCCCEPVLNLDETVAHPHFAARQAFGAMTTAAGETFTRLNQPIRFEPPLAETCRPAPALGEHTREVLLEAGVSERDIADLAARGAFGPPSK